LVRLIKQSCYQGLSLRGQGQDFFLKAKAKAKDMKIFQGQHQGQLGQLPLRVKICIYLKSTWQRAGSATYMPHTVTKTEYAYLIKHNAKETICGGFWCQYWK